VGSVNIGLAQGEAIPAGVDRAVTRPLLLSVGAGTSALQGVEDVRKTTKLKPKGVYRCDKR